MKKEEQLINILLGSMIEEGSKDQEDMGDYVEEIMEEFPRLEKGMGKKEIEEVLEWDKIYYSKDKESDFKYNMNMRYLMYYFSESVSDIITDLLNNYEGLSLNNENYLYTMLEDSKDDLICSLEEALEC